MKKVFYVLSVIVFLVAIYLILRPKPIKVETFEVKRGDFSETLNIEGKVRSRIKKVVYAPATGNISDLDIQVGDKVKKGQKIAKLEWDKTFFLNSPISGVISKVYRNSEGPISRGDAICEISNLDDLEIVVEALTPDVIRMKVKGAAQILNWGGEGSLAAEVSQISRAGTVKISALGVEEERTEVMLKFQKIHPELKNKFGDNYHVDVVFLISQDQNVLTVPLGALFKNQNKWSVYLVRDGKAHLQEIEISKQNDLQALVTSGLNEKDRVILFPGDRIQEGTLVQQ